MAGRKRPKEKKNDRTFAERVFEAGFGPVSDAQKERRKKRRQAAAASRRRGR